MTDKPDLRAALAQRIAARGGAPLASPAFPELFGPFTIYGPDAATGKTGWSFGAWRVWVTGVFASRDACVLVAGMLIADYGETQKLVVQLRDTHNRAVPSVDITVEHILAVTDSNDAEDEEGEEPA